MRFGRPPTASVPSSAELIVFFQHFRRRPWQTLGLFMTGFLFQTAGASCNQIAADVVAGLSSSIATQLIRNVIYDSLDLGTGGFGGLTGLGGLGT
jgi:hypothetical protein